MDSKFYHQSHILPFYRFAYALLLKGLGCWALSLSAFVVFVGISTTSKAIAQDSVGLLAKKGNAELIRKENEKAILTLSEALSVGTMPIYTKVSILNDRAVAYTRVNKYELALDDMNSAIEEFPEYAIAYNNRGLLLMKLGFYKEAIIDFNRSIALQPTQGATFHNRANALLKSGSEAVAFKEYGRAINLLNDKSAPHVARGQIHWEHNRHYAAMRELNRALQQNNNHADALFNRGQIFLSLGDNKNAIKDITKASALSPENNKYKMALAEIYLKKSQYQTVRRLLSQLLISDPMNAKAMVMRGRALGARGSYDTALDDLDQAVSLTDKADAYAERALVRSKNKMPELAAEDMDTAIQRAPKTARSWVALGEAAYMGELIVNAERYYLEALKKDEKNKAAKAGLRKLGWLDEVEEIEAPLDEEIAEWKIVEREKGRFVAIHPKYSKMTVQLDLYGPVSPKILEWTELTGKYKGYGLLRYEAGSKDKKTPIEQVSIISIRKQTVLSIEPFRWGKKVAVWEWGDYDLIVKDPDGIENRIALKTPPKRIRRKVAKQSDWMWSTDGLWISSPQKQTGNRGKRKKSRKKRRKKKKSIFGIFGF